MRRHRYVYLLVLALLPAGVVAAQEGPVNFEFSFSNPGARSMGLGGAFAALADDATAAFSNPAGLVQLLEPELSLEGRSWSYDTPFLTGGRVAGAPTGIGVDTFASPQYGVSSVDFSNISFLSFVYPGKNWSVAVYRHRWADFSVTRQVDSLFGEVDGELRRSEDILAHTDMNVVNNGVAGAFEVSESLSVGGGLVYYQAEIDSVSEEFALDDEMFFEQNPRPPDLLDTSYFLRGKDSGFTAHGGFFWRPASQWSVAGYYRGGPKLTMGVTEIVGPANDELPEGTVELQTDTPLHLPSVFGLGLAHRAFDGALTVSFEWDRVGYASITRSLDDTVFDKDQVSLENGHEFHAGVEYVLVTASPILAFRGGVWRDPAHSLGSGDDADVFEEAIFDGGANELHVSGGAGIVLKHLQFDFGFDLSGTADVLSFSVVYRF